MGFFSSAKVHSTVTSRVTRLAPSTSTSPTSSTTQSSGAPSPRLVKIPADPLTPPPDRAPPSEHFTDDHGAFAFSHLRSNDQLRAIVVGTGFAGLASAIALARQSYSVTLLERSSGLSQHGDSIMFGCNAARVLMRWGVGREMRDRSSQSEEWLFLDEEGKAVWREGLNEFPNKFGAPLLQGSRPHFLGSLGVEARLLGVSIRLDTEVVGYWDSADKPAVVTRSGEVIRGDVIIVADGVHSSARDLLASHRGPPTPRRASGYSIYRGAMKSTAVRDDAKCAHLLDGKICTWVSRDVHAAIYPLDQGRQLAFTVTHRDSSGDASINWRDRKPVRDVLEVIKGWDPALVKTVSHIKSALHWNIMDETPAAEWISTGGKIICCGDAVHALQPTSFQGGSQAVEDGATLAICLALAGGAPSTVGLALEVYELLRRPRVVAAQALGHKQQRLWHTFSSTPSALPSSLLPLTFQLYGHDAEAFAILNFEQLAQEVDPGFRVEEGVMDSVLRNVGLEREDVRQWGRAGR